MKSTIDATSKSRAPMKSVKENISFLTGTIVLKLNAYNNTSKKKNMVRKRKKEKNKENFNNVKIIILYKCSRLRIFGARKF